MRSRFMPVFIVLLATCNPSQPSHDAGLCEGIEPRGPEEIAVCNQLGERLIINVALPEGPPPPDGWPAVILLHGSGGLYETSGEGDELGPCSMELQRQFRVWRDLLTERGYAVAMPASFYSRGICEWHDADHDRLILRVFDTRATEDWLCDQAAIDCDRMALLGFSNGASVALLSAHSDLSVAEDERLREHGPNRPVRGVVAYYPGCGLDGELTSSIDPVEFDRFYSPLAPVLVQHAEHDDLLEDCAESRDPQVEQVDQAAGRRGDWFQLHVYEGAGHGFDGAEQDEDDEQDVVARTAAESSTLQALEVWLDS
jgi:dienelactone hydrolase